MSKATVTVPGGFTIRIDYACGAIALTLAILAVWVSIIDHHYRINTLVRMSRTDAIAVETQGTSGWEYGAVHYDGIYFFAIALDPLAQARAHTEIDLGANRYGHPAYGWAAGIVGLFGPTLVPLSLVLVSLGATFTAAVYASRLSALLGWTPWGGLAIAFNPGLIFAVTNDTSEAFGAALICLSLWAWFSGRLRLATLALIVACFAKEHLLLLPIGLALWEVAQLIRGREPAVGWKRVPWERFAMLGVGPALYALWVVYIHSVFGSWSFAQAENLSLPIPFSGWIDAMRGAAGIETHDYLGYQLGAGTVPLQVIALTLIVIGAIRALKLRSPIDPIYLLLAIVMVYLGNNQVFFAKDLERATTFAFVLLPFVLITPRWPLAPAPLKQPST